MAGPIRVTFFGTAAGFPTMKRAHTTSIGVWWEESLYLFDAGASVASQFSRLDIHPDDPHAIFLTHLHADHVGGLAVLLQWLQLNKRRKTLPLFVPDASLDGIRDYLHLVYLFPLGDFDLDLRPVAGGFAHRENGVEVLAVTSHHLEAGEQRRRETGARAVTQAFSYLITASQKRIYFSGDIAEPGEAGEHASGADLAVIELAHFEPEELGEALSGSSLPRLVVTHLLDTFEPVEHEIPARINAAGYEGEITVAEDGLEVEL